MRTYPLGPSDISAVPEAINAESTCFEYSYNDLVQMINSAFYDGFMLAFCKTIKNYEAIDTRIRILAASAAITKLATFQGRDQAAQAARQLFNSIYTEERTETDGKN